MTLSFIKSNWFPLIAGLLLSPFFIAVLPIFVDYASMIQERMLPVISDWKITNSKIEGTDLIVSGTMRKNRDCIFLPPTLARDQNGLNHRVISKASAGGTTWAADDEPQQWGPWVVPDGAGKKLTFINVYLCGSRPAIIELGEFK
jgi:hypothetical protein